MPETKRRQLPVLGARHSAPASHDVGAEGVRIGLITLGCDKNTVDSERVLARLASSGASVRTDADDVDVVVINTCGFIDNAKEESIEAVLDAVRMKQQGRVKAVVAMGCLVQRYKQELQDEIPEVDAFLSLTETDELIPILRGRGLLSEKPPLMERPLRLISTTTPHTSHLKISEGCDHTCAFCAIPLMRGKHRSIPIDVLVAEAQELQRRGVVELNIVSQDTTWYGRDVARGVVDGGENYFVGRVFDAMPNVQRAPDRASVPGRETGVRGQLLPDLLKALLAETDIPWLRLFYMYPSGIRRELVELIAREPRIVRYLDMPLQHGSDRVLQRMRRPERQRTIRERVHWLRDAVPELALRTTLIVGFPGETDDDFRQLLDLVEEIRFDYIGAFAYSPEEGTLAEQLSEQVPLEVKRERLEQLLELQRSITLEKNEARVGQRSRVLIDRVRRQGAIGRTEGQAMEVDGVVKISNGGHVRPGDFVDVRITAAAGEDLAGALIGSH